MVQNRTSRQRAGRPVVSFRVSAALHREAENFRRTHGLTWEALLQQAVAGGVQPDVKEAYRQGQQDGFLNARQEFGLRAWCCRCRELTWVYANQFQRPLSSRAGQQYSMRFFCPHCWEAEQDQDFGSVHS